MNLLFDYSGQLMSIKDEVHNVMGDNIQDSLLEEVIIKNKFNLEATLNELLSSSGKPYVYFF